MRRVNEGQSAVDLYKFIVMMYAQFCDAYSTNKVGTYKKLIDRGASVLPKDARAVQVIESIVYSVDPNTTYSQGRGGIVDNIQPLENTTFAELPVTVRPVYVKESGERCVAVWAVKDGDEVKKYEKVFDLLKLDGEKDGYWADKDGNKVELEDIVK